MRLSQAKKDELLIEGAKALGKYLAKFPDDYDIEAAAMWAQEPLLRFIKGVGGKLKWCEKCGDLFPSRHPCFDEPAPKAETPQ